MNFRIKEFYTELNAFEIYKALGEEKNTILLDSSKEDSKYSKFSFIGLNPYKIFKSFGNKIEINGVESVGKPFEVLESQLEDLSRVYIDKAFDHIPFIAGAIGYFSYDSAWSIEDLPDNSVNDYIIPQIYYIFFDNLIIFDHEKDKKYITSLGILEDSQKSIAKINDRINSGVKLKEVYMPLKSNTFYSNFSKEEYIKAIATVKDYIKSGDVYIANLTQRMWCYNEEEASIIYQRLRQINKAPFSAYLNLDGFEVISSSPERFIAINNGELETRPIKGTRPRGKNKEEDEKFKAELINSEKDKAELLMIVDLERNDLSKVCKPHSVKVTELFKLEEYATVFHLVSTVRGKLKEGMSPVKALKECFPGGSITGTPKIRAMEVIEELEGVKRNLYTGSIGYFDIRGNADFNIVIRTIVKKDGKAYFGVGGGITIDSLEELEYEETLDKAKALMRVL